MKRVFLNYRQNGFTLLEVLVAIALLGMSLLVITRLFSANLRAISVSEDYIVAVARAESRLRELIDDKDLQEKEWSETAGEGYNIDASVKEALKDRTEALKFRLLEIDVTVHWRKLAKDKSVTLRTLKMVERVL
ncbi:MAG: prepilin-type N-terminal cleavage/methylation domain-containing protein [Nitrospirae bacterium]|nr:prepilin-type N-terminal cleavage/methylation domain-containing protein [Nitrospirota bacterium]